MNPYRDILFSLLKRMFFALPFLGFGFFTLFHARGGMIMGVVFGLMGCAGLLIGSIILAFPLARTIAEPVGNLYFSNRRFARPPPIYGIPESRRKQGLYEEAIAEYEKIADQYPREVKPYIDMIDIAIVNLEDPERANAIYQHGISILKKQADKEVLARMYSAIRTRLGTPRSS